MAEQQPTADTPDMTRMLNRLTQEKDIAHAVLFTTDGLVLTHSESLHRDVADRISASASSLFSLGRGIGEFAQTPEGESPRKIIIDLPNACVLVFSAGHRSALAVSVSAEMTEPEVAIASAATIKAARGLASALSALTRTKAS
ncbi:roadblock/LC7 domain-containing protein [Streptomyces chartreusis]|uniref:roadblock/LC7 domain-containing protein n=1 Tax=Streptomyces chartreusis TaxID=1969 RepID=UPI0033C75D70